MAAKSVIGSAQQTNFPNGIAILVMGLTGAGKSTFISRLTQQEVEIGHSLESCTKDAMGYELHRPNGQKVFLIDTPGFDDTHADNSKILRQIASFVCIFCDGKYLRIGGIIYAHRITDTRMAGSSLKSLRIFEEICGSRCFHDITILTTMWDQLRSARSQAAADQREKVLRERPEFFGTLIAGGATMIKHDGSKRDALAIIENLASRNRNVVLRLQLEMLSDSGMTLAETSPGRYLEGELASTRKKYDMEMQELQQLERDISADNAMMEGLREQKQDWEERLHASELYQKSLFITREDMARERKEWVAETQYNIESSHSTEEDSSEVLALKSQLERTKLERDRLLQENKVQRQEDQARIDQGRQHVEALEKILDDQTKKDKGAKERMDKLKSLNFLELVRATLNLNPVKELTNLARRSESSAAEIKAPKRTKKQISKRADRSKSRKAEKYGHKSRASPDQQLDVNTNGILQETEQTSSDSEESSEDENIIAAQHVSDHETAGPDSPSAEYSLRDVLANGKPSARQTIFDPRSEKLRRVYPPAKQPHYLQAEEVQRMNNRPIHHYDEL